MKYTLINRNKSFNTNSNTEFVRLMRKNDLENFRENSEFMKAYSHHKITFEKINLRFDTEDNFVEDLEKNNLLKIEECSKPKWNLFKK